MLGLSWPIPRVYLMHRHASRVRVCVSFISQAMCMHGIVFSAIFVTLYNNFGYGVSLSRINGISLIIFVCYSCCLHLAIFVTIYNNFRYGVSLSHINGISLVIFVCYSCCLYLANCKFYIVYKFQGTYQLASTLSIVANQKSLLYSSLTINNG